MCLKLQRHQAKKETLFIAFYVDDYTHCSKSSASTLFSISLPFGFVSAYFFVDVWSLHCIDVTFEHCQVLGEFLGLRIAKRNLEKQEKQPLLLRPNTATVSQLDDCLDTSSTVNTFVLKCIYLIPSTPTIKPRLTQDCKEFWVSSWTGIGLYIVLLCVLCSLGIFWAILVMYCRNTQVHDKPEIRHKISFI